MPADVWLCLRFDQLALDAFGDDPASPDIVLQQHRVIAVSREGAEQGLHIGMSANQAMMMVPGCRRVERDTDKERRRLEMLAHWAYQYTPEVSLADHSLLLEVGHCLTLFQGFDRLYALVEKDLERFSVSVKPGVAHTPAAAYVLSHALNNGVSLARQGVVDADQFLLLLGQADIATLDVTDREINRLQGCGFEVLEDLLLAPREDIGLRFGQGLLDYLARLLGEKEDPQVRVAPPEPFSEAMDFPEPIHNCQWIEQCADQLLQSLCRFLRQRQWVCRSLLWRFYNDKQLMAQLPIALSSRHYSIETFKQLTGLHLEKLRLSGELMRIELFVDQLLPAQLVVDDLFDPRIEQREVSALVDKLSSRLGEGAVYRVASVAEPVPELSLRQYPFEETERPYPHRHILPQSLDQCHGGAATPIRREFQPLWLLSELRCLSSSDDDKPQPLDRKGRPLQLIQGPDRIDSHWWCSAPQIAGETGGCRHRDYYIARQQNGRLLWVFFERRQKRWFLHGLFG